MPPSLAAVDSLPVLRLVPDLRIDGHAEDLVGVHPVAVGGGGTLAVGQRMDRQVRIYTQAGQLVAKVGRDGEGPGEFRGVGSVGWIGDTLWVDDPMLNRLTFFRSDGSLVRTVGLPARGHMPGSFEDAGELSVRALRSDGTIMAKVTESPEDPGRFVRVTPEGGILEVLAEDWDPDGSWVTVHRSGGRSTVGLPFAAARMSRVYPDGSRLVFVSAEVEGEEAGTFRVVVVGLGGDTLVARRYPCDVVQIPRRVGDSVIAARARELRGRRSGTEVAAAFERHARVPLMYPPIWDVLVGRDGTIWIHLRRTEEGDPFLVLDPHGLPIGRVVLGENAVVSVAERGWIWTVEWDEFDVHSIVRYRVEGYRGEQPRRAQPR